MPVRKLLVKSRRESCGYTVEQCAEILGIPLESYLKKEKGSAYFMDSELNALRKLFECTLDSLYE